MTSRQGYLGFWLGLFLIGLTGCGPALAPTPAKVNNSRCLITSLTLDSIEQTSDTITLQAGSHVVMRCEGKTVGIYGFPSKMGRLLKPPVGSKAGTEIKYLTMFLVTTIVRAGSNNEDVVEVYFESDRSIDTLVDCDERSFSWKQEFQAPTRRGNYEFRIYGYWRGEPEVEPGTPHTPDSHVLGTWKIVVE